MADEPRAQSPHRGLRAWLGLRTRRDVLVWLALIVGLLLVKGCVIDQHTVSSNSMAPTLHGDPRMFRGDRILVNKWLYGPRIPLTSLRFWNWGEPDRWDIVVFRAVEQDAAHPVLVKRVAGLPGETLRLSEGYVYVDGEKQPFPAGAPEHMWYYNAADVRKHIQYWASTDEQRDLLAALEEQRPMRFAAEPEQTVQVPDNCYFLLGDNSLWSRDSRYYGCVPHGHLMGRVAAVWWPWGRRQDFTGWTATWWGMALLYGLPTALVIVELFRWRNRRRGHPRGK